MLGQTLFFVDKAGDGDRETPPKEVWGADAICQREHYAEGHPNQFLRLGKGGRSNNVRPFFLPPRSHRRLRTRPQISYRINTWHWAQALRFFGTGRLAPFR